MTRLTAISQLTKNDKTVLSKAEIIWIHGRKHPISYNSYSMLKKYKIPSVSKFYHFIEKRPKGYYLILKKLTKNNIDRHEVYMGKHYKTVVNKYKFIYNYISMKDMKKTEFTKKFIDYYLSS